MEGIQEKDAFILNETFLYDDGEEEFRKWIITKTSETTYRGESSDIKGFAEGKRSGNAINWHYTLKLKYKDGIISYENGILNDHSAWLGKIYNLNVKDIQSIARWSRSKRVNEYKLVVGQGHKSGNQIKKLMKRRSLYIKDTVVNSDALLKLAEMIGNDVAQRNQSSTT